MSASGGKNAALVYDPLGRLFQTSGGAAGVTQFLYDDDALIGEYDSAGTMVHRYVHGTGKGVDDPLIWYHNSVGGWRRALVADQQGSIVAVAHMLGHAIAVNAYDEYGIPDARNQGRFQYTGQAWIPELGMYYYKARIYSPTLGRFLQVDPIGYEGGINLYGYVRNDPVNRIDPTGLADLNLVRPSDRAYATAENTDYQGAFTVVGHSNFLSDGRIGIEDQRARGGAPVLTPRELLSAAEANGYQKGRLTLLISCEVAMEGRRSFAQEYANISGGRVIASLGSIGITTRSPTSVVMRVPLGFLAYDRGKTTGHYMGNRITYNPKTGIGVMQVTTTGSRIPTKVRTCLAAKCDP